MMIDRLPQGKGFVFVRKGHPHANLYLRYLCVISDEEAGFKYDDETKKLFEEHVKNCGHCSFIMEGYFDGLAKSNMRKTLQSLTLKNKEVVS